MWILSIIISIVVLESCLAQLLLVKKNNIPGTPLLVYLGILTLIFYLYFNSVSTIDKIGVVYPIIP